MPLQTIQLKPGVDTEQTVLLNEQGWSSSNLIRWREGLVEKLGGWAHINNSQGLVGTGRGATTWSDLSSNSYLGIGTEQRLLLFAFGNLYDITPITKTDNISPAFTTVISTTSVIVTDAGHGAVVGDWILIPVPVSIGGVILQGFYQVVTVVDNNNFTITSAVAAASSAGPGGAVPLFNTTNGSAQVKVTLNNHGLVAGSPFGVQVQTIVGGITIAVGQYIVDASPAVTTNDFRFTPGAAAGSTTSGSENGGNVRIEYLLVTGQVTSVAQSGWGGGAWGAGTWGGANGTVNSTIRQWLLDHWGQDLIGNYTNGPLVVWTPPVVPVPVCPWPTTWVGGAPTTPIPANPALVINTTNYPSATSPPTAVTASFVSMPQRILVALGSDPVGGGQQDFNLVRWSDVDDFTKWVATATNQAGSYRLPNGSKIVGGIQGPNFGVIWTDVDLWLMNYIGFPLVWGFTKVGDGCHVLAARAMASYNGVIYWVSDDNFFIFDGNSVQVLECTVFDQFFYNLNAMQTDKVWCWVNALFNEIWWFYPSLNSSEVDSYVKFNISYKVWDYGSLIRTCGVPSSSLGPPIASDTSNYLQQHEVGYNNDGNAMMPFVQSGFFRIADGSFFTMVERLLADFVVTGGVAPNNRVLVKVLVQDFTTSTIYEYGPFSFTSAGPPYSIVRGRGRAAAIRIYSTDLSVFWRMGAARLLLQPSGRR